MRRLEQIEWEACFLPLAFDAAAARTARRTLGFVPPTVYCLVPCPWLVHAYPALFPARLCVTALDSRLCDLVCLVVAQDNSCRYCYAASRLFLKLLGMPEKAIRGLEEDLFTAGLEPPTATALTFAQQLSRANPPPGSAERRALLDLGFSAAAIAELASVAAVNVFYNRLCTLTAMPTARLETAGRSRLVRLLQPVIRIGVRVGRWRMRPAAPAGKPVVRPGPFAEVL